MAAVNPTMSPMTPPPSARNVTFGSRSSRHLSSTRFMTSRVLLSSPSGITRVSFGGHAGLMINGKNGERGRLSMIGDGANDWSLVLLITHQF